MRDLALSIIGATLLSGCKSTDPKLASENNRLRQQVDQQIQRIHELTEGKALLAQQNEDLRRKNGVLQSEKGDVVGDLSTLRSQVRRSVVEQISDLKGFLSKSELLDYIGAEIIPRNNIEARSITLIDAEHPIPYSGSINALGAYVVKPTKVKLQILRPTDNNTYISVWDSPLISLDIIGENTVNFSASIGIKKGDVIAYYFPENVGVGYDSGIGSMLHTSKPIDNSGDIRVNKLKPFKNGRNYAIGVYALLDYHGTN